MPRPPHMSRPPSTRLIVFETYRWWKWEIAKNAHPYLTYQWDILFQFNMVVSGQNKFKKMMGVNDDCYVHYIQK